MASTSFKPWEDARDSLRGAITDAGSLYESGGFAPDPYGGRRVAAMDDIQRKGISGLAGAARSYNPTLQGGLAGLKGATNVSPYKKAARRSQALGKRSKNTLMGLMNPKETYRDFDRIRETVMDDTKAALGSTFAGGGLESGLAQMSYGRGMGDALGQLEYDSWNQAQDRALQAAGMAPGIMEAQGIAPGMIEGARTRQAGNMLDAYRTGEDVRRRAAEDDIAAGGMLQQQRQNLLDAQRARYEEEAGQERDNYLEYLNAMMGLGGMGGSQKQSTSFGDILKGGLAMGLGGLAKGLGGVF